MADGARAADRLGRLLHILPAAAVEGGADLADLARDLDVDRSTVLADLTEVTARSYHHPAGAGDDVQIRIESERVSVWTSGPFRRPVRLSRLEAFCLALGLRPRRSGDGLLRRVEAHLASGPPPPEISDRLHAEDAGADPEGVRDLLVAAARDRLRCRIRYLKPSDPEPEDRVIHPHAVAHAEGRWYVVGWCEASDGARAFRLDRVLAAERVSGSFEAEAEAVDVEAFLEGGQVYHADRETEVVVRYSATVRRWVEEWAPDIEESVDGGGVLVRHRVADPDWVVRHVLAYGGEAEVVEPASVRELVGSAARERSG